MSVLSGFGCGRSVRPGRFAIRGFRFGFADGMLTNKPYTFRDVNLGSWALAVSLQDFSLNYGMISSSCRCDPDCRHVLSKNPGAQKLVL